MRIWSIHPKYLDRQGLLAVWRETLLAKKVLENKTKGYKNHPQLIRFKNSKSPAKSIDAYLEEIWFEAKKRGYFFNKEKFKKSNEKIFLEVTKGQVEYEFKHLLKKLEKRDIVKFKKIKYIEEIKTHPLFKIVQGEVEKWEKT
jgi:hypothetical protein